jgi:GTP-binding protein
MRYDGSMSATGPRLPVVVLTGRPNVGKSTLFNRIVGERRAVVEATPGVTRDSVYAEAEWAGREFAVADTGGLAGGEADPFAPLVWEQAEAALRGADVVVLVVDAQAGLCPGDRDIAERVRRLGRPVVLVANKCDRWGGAAAAEFYALGLGEPLAVSGARGEGLGDALDRVVAALPPALPKEDEARGQEPIAVAVVGRPNVGKSSLVNRLLGRERLIVSGMAGTTRDAVDVPWEADGRSFVLVDTPGLRRPARVDPHGLEHTVARGSAAAIRRAEVVALVLDATLPCTDQDKRIAGLAKDGGRAVLVLCNKADLLPPPARAGLPDLVRGEMPFLAHALFASCSARTGEGLERLPRLLGAAGDAFRSRIPTSALNQALRAAVALQPPPAHRGQPVRIFYAAQIASRPPAIALVTNRRGALGDGYVRYLERHLRERFGLEGTPVRWRFRVRAHRALHVAGGAAPRRMRRAPPTRT